MNHVRTALCTACIVLFVLGLAPAIANDYPAIDMLEKAQAKMKELAEKDLPNQDLGKKTQDREEVVIETLDKLIQMILDEQARQDPSPPPGPPIPPEKPGPPGPNDKPRPGEVRGNTFGNCEPDRRPGEEWGQLPEKDFDKPASDSDVKGIPGYEKIIERYRAVKAENQNKVDE